MNIRILLSLSFFLLIILTSGAQSLGDSNSESAYSNSVEGLINSPGNIKIGGYGEAHYNQSLTKGQKDLGTLDLHRMVMFLGYNFSKNTSFISEIEFEYAKELWVEQAFLQHKLSKYVNLRAGLMIVPMGIINEFHEPVTFNGVERPVIDNKISLSTWREIGAGFSGTILPVSMKYQLYIMNGLSGYDGKALFTGGGLREGRQKGSKAYIHSPSFSGKVEYFGIRSLNIGLSGYAGKSQSKLFNKLHEDSTSMVAKADSSVVGIAMVGVDARYKISGLELRGQFYLSSLSNTAEYNQFSSVDGKNNDLGSSMMGYYVEAGYNVLRHCKKTSKELIPFVRYEFYNTHNTVEADMAENAAYENTVITTGLTFKVHKNAVLKSDLQFTKSAAATEYSKIFNAGIGVMF
ncbi:MAG TPA: hypothetical protein VK212_03180 [Lentimicrobium sp.]|nr:hypothetical protein [Lentimicrobium sp.]